MEAYASRGTAVGKVDHGEGDIIQPTKKNGLDGQRLNENPDEVQN